jgi:hypothetical protein
MPAPHPHSLADLSLAPVLIGIEQNLAQLRAVEDLEFDLALELNDDGARYTRAAERARRIARCAVRNIDLHGWQVEPTADLYGLAVRHGEYQVSLMLGKRLTAYVERLADDAVAGPLP